MVSMLKTGTSLASQLAWEIECKHSAVVSQEAECKTSVKTMVIFQYDSSGFDVLDKILFQMQEVIRILALKMC